MKFSRALVAASLASATHAWGLDIEHPNLDHPGTRDIFVSTPGDDIDYGRPIYVAVPNYISLEQVYSIEIVGRLISFINGETWFVVGHKRVIRFNPGFFDEFKGFWKDFKPADYPIIASDENLDALLGESMRIDELRALAALEQRADMERPLIQTKKILMHGYTLCHCSQLDDENGTC
ncbi:hypothetical protein NLG97_g9472 [Lecanicillium saksenae]|uniref:Uncharacterized protein n=1 Tax=Lecanicillium saksenae TaxID=468837 RepID=A0ACC1QIE9_9HYPO|nr:hypothetical protein NLG97_g9472 [Lecanicillium saksenae]